jgi:hypothetical protein
MKRGVDSDLIGVQLVSLISKSAHLFYNFIQFRVCAKSTGLGELASIISSSYTLTEDCVKFMEVCINLRFSLIR